MTSRTVLCGILVLSVGGEVTTLAQLQPTQAAPQQTPAAVLPVPDTTRRQVEGFERILQGSITAAAQQLNSRLIEAVPNVQFQLQFQAQPLVTGVVMPDDQVVFHVLIPAIEQTGVRIIDSLLAMQQRGSAASAGSDVRRVSGNVMVEPDPAGVRFDPNAEYTKYARQALIDAVLDHGMSVQIAPDKTLTIVADELLPPSIQLAQRSKSLILQISGADLLSLRQARISRDDARTKIREFRY